MADLFRKIAGDGGLESVMQAFRKHDKGDETVKINHSFKLKIFYLKFNLLFNLNAR